MKISKLIEKLKKAQSEYGDLTVSFYEGSVNPNVDPEFSVHDVEILGAYKVPMYDTNRNRKDLVLVAKKSIEFIFGNDKLTTKTNK